MSMKRMLFFIILVSVLFLSQCKHFLFCPEGTQVFNEYQLFFGQSDNKGNPVVNDTKWDHFLSQYIRPRFPNGLTVYDTKGQWQNSFNQIIKEHSKVLLILASPKDTKSSLKIREIREKYKKQFQQESVLLLT